MRSWSSNGKYKASLQSPQYCHTMDISKSYQRNTDLVSSKCKGNNTKNPLSLFGDLFYNYMQQDPSVLSLETYINQSMDFATANRLNRVIDHLSWKGSLRSVLLLPFTDQRQGSQVVFLTHAQVFQIMGMLALKSRHLMLIEGSRYRTSKISLSLGNGCRRESKG